MPDKPVHDPAAPIALPRALVGNAKPEMGQARGGTGLDDPGAIPVRRLHGEDRDLAGPDQRPEQAGQAMERLMVEPDVEGGPGRPGFPVGRSLGLLAIRPVPAMLAKYLGAGVVELGEEIGPALRLDQGLRQTEGKIAAEDRVGCREDEVAQGGEGGFAVGGSAGKLGRRPAAQDA